MADGSMWPGSGTGSHQIITGDCLTEMGRMEEGSFDVVVTSPPYNLNLSYNTYKDTKSDEDYLNWMENVGAAVKRVLKPSGSFFLNITGSNTRPWLPFEVIVGLKKQFELQNHITWVKSISMGVDSTGHFKPIPGKRFIHHNHEHIFHLTKTGSVTLDRFSIGIPFKDKTNISRRGHERDIRCRGNTWFIPYSTVKSKTQKFNHPATFPLELPLWCIYLHGERAAKVLDPFAGAGSTLVAAQHAGATCVGIELDPSYADAARTRLRASMEESVLLTLDADEVASLLKQDPATRGQGGFQNLMLNFQDRLNKTTCEMTINENDIEQIQNYAFKYKGGGWQSRLREIFERHLGINLDGVSSSA